MVSTMLRVGRALLCGVWVALALTGSSFGQAADGNLVGSVLDSTGAVIPGAMVEVENVATGVKAATTSDEAGFYRFNNLLVGSYRVTGGRAGFASSSREVTIELNKAATANLILSVGGVAQDVTVSEATALIDTTTAQVTNNYSTRLVADLPLAANPIDGAGNGGGVYNLSLTGAGVTSSGGVGTGFGPSVGGQRPRNNNFTVEGTDNNRKDTTGTVVDVPVDAIKEFSVLQNQFSAEFGHSSGGQFNVVLMGGTNEIHGAAYEYFQNRKLNAIDESAKRQPGPITKPRFDQNIAGGQLGGPIRKNKLFYFGSFDYNPIGQESSAALRYSPTAAGYTMLASIPGLSQTNLGILKQYVPAAPSQSRTAAVTGSDGVVRTIPLGAFPILAPNYQNEYRWLGSIDYNMSDVNQWRGRFIANKIDTIDTGNGTTNLPVFFLTRPIRQTLISVSQFHAFSPSVANELRLAYNRYTSVVSAGDFKFPGLDVFPNLQIRDDLNLQIGPNPQAPQAVRQNTYQLSENVSWFKAGHDLKFGFDGRDLIACSCPPFVQRVRGDYNYTTLDFFLRDLTPDLVAQRTIVGSIGGNYNGNNYQLFFYANDNWKVSRRLALNLGVRYEFTSVPTSMREFDLNSIADVPGRITFRAPASQKKNFAPRIGFAYSPGNSGATSFRGGFGIAYDLIFDNIGINTRPPQATSGVDRTDPDTENSLPGFLARGGIPPNAVAPAATPASARAATSGYLPDQKLGYSINWNLGVQHTFGKDYTAEVRYLGSRGVHLLAQTQLNRNAIVTADHNLPLFFSAPAQSVLDALPLTRAQLDAERTSIAGNPLLDAGFAQTISSYAPRGNSEYHGLAVDVNKRFSKHILFKAAYTWSHLMDDSTAEINSTTLSPRRPEDFNNMRKEWANSLLDRRHRASFAWDYTTPWFEKSSNLLLQKIAGNWQFSGAWIYESPEYATPQSAADANLNGDSAADRVVINNNGDTAVSSDITALTSLRNGAIQTVAYLVNNPSAYYIRARPGVYTTSGRNILRMRPIDNFDLSIAKTVPLKERYQIHFRVDMYNAFNHPQYTPGRPNRVSSFPHSGETTYLTPGLPDFAQWDKVLPSNARQLQLTAKFRF